MGKELSMARSKRKRGRPSVLLAGSRPRLPIYPSNRRNQRKETTTINKEAKRGKTKDTSPACSTSTEAEVLHGNTSTTTEREGHIADNQDRQPDSRTKGDDSQGWRSAEELGIDWLTDSCQDHQPHYLVDSHKIYNGSLFKCTNCEQFLWLPTNFEDARKLDILMDLHGTRKGYLHYLDTNRPVKIILAKLQELWRAKKQNPNSGEFVLKVIEVMGDHNYGRIQ